MNKSSIPQAKCVYCGKLGATKEHFWGKWSRKHAIRQAVANSHVVTRRDSTTGAATAVEKGALDRPGAARSQRLKIACRDCNGGWMKKIVDDAIPFITPLSKGNWQPLNLSEQRFIAAWATLFTMSFEYADRATVVVPQIERERFRLEGCPSPEWRIFIGAIDAEDQSDSALHRALQTDPLTGLPSILSQITTFVFGKLLIQTIYRQAIPDEYAEALHLTQIWPTIAITPFHPSAWHTDASFWMVATILSEALQRGADSFDVPVNPADYPQRDKAHYLLR